MGERGQKPLEERIGIDKFKELLKRLQPQDIAKLYCNHFLVEEEKQKCKACLRTIYRAKKRVEEKESKEKRFDPIEDFELIPEVEHFKAFHQNRKHLATMTNMMRDMWLWIRQDPNLKELQRPALWDERHLLLILQKLKERGCSQYAWKETLRRFFESQNNFKMMKHKLIKASRADQRSPKGAKRKETEFAPSLIPRIHSCLTEDQRLIVDFHITAKSREESLLGVEWQYVNWGDDFYGFSTVTIDIFESKTSGGTWWRHIPLDLWFGDLSKRLRAKWESLGCPKEGTIFRITYPQYRGIWKKISKRVGKKLEPHDCRRSAGGWLRDLGLSELALGQYNPTRGDAIGYTGVGWENSEIYFQRYGKMNPKAIFDKKKLDIEVFDGLIRKIGE
jgi:hypothetical protein